MRGPALRCGHEEQRRRGGRERAVIVRTGAQIAPRPSSGAMKGSDSRVGGTNVSLIVRGLTQRIRFHIDPALSFVPGCPCAAEGLLADDRPGRLVVHVEVPGRVPELLVGELERVELAREDGAGEAVGRALVDEVERLAVLVSPGRRRS